MSLVLVVLDIFISWEWKDAMDLLLRQWTLLLWGLGLIRSGDPAKIFAKCFRKVLRDRWTHLSPQVGECTMCFKMCFCHDGFLMESGVSDLWWLASLATLGHQMILMTTLVLMLSVWSDWWFYLLMKYGPMNKTAWSDFTCRRSSDCRRAIFQAMLWTRWVHSEPFQSSLCHCKPWPCQPSWTAR